MTNVHISPDAQDLAETAAQHFLWLGNEAIRSSGRFVVAFAGGSTPKNTYRFLSSPEYATRINWRLVHVFWGDERFVPPDHPESNYRMTKETLLDRVSIPPGNIHRMRGELEPQKAADEYETHMKRFFEGQPHFDLVLLGLGADGHTASLFPGTKAIQETERWVISHFVEKLDAWRITLTPAIVNQARNINFIVSGKGKASILQRVLHGPRQPMLLPSQIIAPVNGTISWLVDASAASQLDHIN
jgi:6-phosphogluconolactonase